MTVSAPLKRLGRRPELSAYLEVTGVSDAHVQVIRSGAQIGRATANEFPAGSGVYYALLPDVTIDSPVTLVWHANQAVRFVDQYEPLNLTLT